MSPAHVFSVVFPFLFCLFIYSLFGGGGFSFWELQLTWVTGLKPTQRTKLVLPVKLYSVFSTSISHYPSSWLVVHA